MKKLVVTLAFLMALATLPAQLWGQGWWGMGPGAAANPLVLTPQQQAEYQEIMTKWQTDITPLWTALQAKGAEVQALMWNQNADPSAVEAKTKEYGELQAEMQRKSTELRNSIRDILTEEQRTIYDQMGTGYGGFGWGRGPCGLGLGAAWGGGFGRGRGGGGWGRGGGAGWGRGAGAAYGPAYGRGVPGAYGPRLGRGPCGMGLGRTGFTPWMGRWPW